MTPLQKFIATLALLLVAGGGIYFFFARLPQGAPAGGTATTTAQVPSSASSTPSATPSLVTPDSKKPIAFSASVSADIRAQLNADLKIVQGQIAANPLNIGPWINLGTLHKMGGDYANAQLYWEYVASSYSGKSVPYYSLGDLYENFLKDYVKAEANYKLAISVDPQNVNAYASLFTMYHYTLHDDTKAAAILDAGLKANPGNNYLLGLKTQLNAK